MIFAPSYVPIACPSVPATAMVSLRAWIFLPRSRHDALIRVMQKLIEWTRAAK